MVLSSIDLDCNIEVSLKFLDSSKSYFLMSLSLLNQLTDLELSIEDTKIFIEKKQRANSSKIKTFAIEDDWSSAASMGCLAALSEGKIRIENLRKSSLQVDSRITRIFDRMGVVNSIEENSWTIESSKNFNGIKLGLGQSPDLFPVLAVLCAFASSSSEFTGLKNLRYKESNRLKNIETFLRALGCGLEVNDDSLSITKTLDRAQLSQMPFIDLSPDSDHRIAMAGAVAIQAGARVTIDNKTVVKKSFSHFWDIQRSLS
jgi:3-phosphoshikimate 1-carboxyvinyltransferase